ncbi:Resolvase [Klebsormidium nitens]|uniref:Resolvase n=1 Tax=Klebsormidium nitens TaxID=105231 RepID=A0A1Y1I529_KLENI|nr:Resolvase [Klebsormidium nitens]|eukprot:GAQ86054.1 Resolvase [Klebsormidium nitens]
MSKNVSRSTSGKSFGNGDEEEEVGEESEGWDNGAEQEDEDGEDGGGEGEDEEREYEDGPCNAVRCQCGFDAVYQQTLGVDLGDRNTGVAISWGDVGAPRSLQVLQLPWDELIRRLLELAESEGADEIVVGLPLQLGTGNESNQARKSRTFAVKLAAAANARGVRVYLFDEALTSKDAMSYMIKTGVKRKTRKANLDAMAAAVLLETYFRDGGCKAERVAPPLLSATRGALGC